MSQGKKRSSFFALSTKSRSQRLATLVTIAIISAIISLALGYYAITFTSPAGQATIIVSVITLLGTIFTALYGEISSYYKDINANNEKKWNLVLPYATKYYKPWINVAIGLQHVLSNYDLKTRPQQDLIHILYLITVFYGYRLKFVIEAGSLILLSTNAAERKVEDKYREVERSMNWVGSKTSFEISKLQYLWVTANSTTDPLVQFRFNEIIRKSDTPPRYEDMLKELDAWLSTDTIKKASDALMDFSSTFDRELENMYSNWQS